MCYKLYVMPHMPDGTYLHRKTDSNSIYPFALTTLKLKMTLMSNTHTN